MKNKVLALAFTSSLLALPLMAEEKAAPSATPWDNPTPGAKTLEKYDANKDGKLDDAERAEWKKSVLEKYDTNKDGALDEAELKAMSEAKAKAKGGKKKEGGEKAQ